MGDGSQITDPYGFGASNLAYKNLTESCSVMKNRTFVLFEAVVNKAYVYQLVWHKLQNIMFVYLTKVFADFCMLIIQKLVSDGNLSD